MDVGVAVLSGAIHKLYDDLVDNGVNISSQNLEIIKVLMVCLMTIAFISNIGFSFFFLILILVYWFVGKIDTEFWIACIPIPIITTIVNIHQFEYIGIIDIIQRFVFIVWIAVISVAEDKIFPEETSILKTLFRIGLIITSIIIMYFTQSFTSYPFIKTTALFYIGYLLANLCYHLMWNKASDKAESSPDSQPHTES
jgi:hypothetical protein